MSGFIRQEDITKTEFVVPKSDLGVTKALFVRHRRMFTGEKAEAADETVCPERRGTRKTFSLPLFRSLIRIFILDTPTRNGGEHEKHFSPSPFSLAYSYLCKQNNLLTMRLLRLIPLIMTLCLAVACSDDDGDGNKHDMRHRRTVIVYMSAQNSLGAANAAQTDSSEIAGGAMQMTSTRDNLLLYLDDNRNPRLYRYYKAGNGKAYVQKVKEYQTDLDSSDPSTLTEVLTTVKNLYPSESYGLVMWSHGTGWLPQMGRPTLTAGTGSLRTTQSIGIDVGPGGNMESDLDAEGHMGPQMETADMARAIVASGVHPDFVFFDACLMQCIEVAYDLREATDYVVGSPATTSAYGAYYRDQMRSGFFNCPSNDQTIRSIVDTYYYDVMENDTTKDLYTPHQGCVMSVIKTSELEQLAYATAQCIGLASEHDMAGELSNLMDGYIDYDSMHYPDMYDMSTALYHLLPAARYEEWRKAVDRCVIYRRATPEYFAGNHTGFIVCGETDMRHYCGVAMFFPQDKYNPLRDILNFKESYKKIAWYSHAGWATTLWYRQ